MNDSAYDEGCIILLLHPPMQQLFACVQVGTNFSLHRAHIPMPYRSTIAHIEGIKESENQKSGSNTQTVQCMQCHRCLLSPVPTWKV